MERIPQSILELNQEDRRADYALKWKEGGKKVVGILCSYVPEEIIHAAGMLPWRVMGTPQSHTPHGNYYRPPKTCLYCNHVLESLVGGSYDFLDAVVTTSVDQDMVRLWDAWKYLGKTPRMHIIHLPLSDTPAHQRQFIKEVDRFLRFIEDLSGERVSEQSLRNSITTYNRYRTAINRLYDLRKSDAPPVSGSDVCRITLASLLMPREEFTEQLESVLPGLEKNAGGGIAKGPRVLLSSDRLDNPGFIDLVEDAGCIVAMDDFDTGGRHFRDLVETSHATSRETLIKALAERYHAQPASPFMMNWEAQVDQIVRWVREFSIHGVVELPLMYSRSRQMRTPFFKARLTDHNIPVASFEREYHMANVGQLTTRIGAFLEILQ